MIATQKGKMTSVVYKGKGVVHCNIAARLALGISYCLALIIIIRYHPTIAEPQMSCSKRSFCFFLMTCKGLPTE